MYVYIYIYIYIYAYIHVCSILIGELAPWPLEFAQGRATYDTIV